MDFPFRECVVSFHLSLISFDMKSILSGIKIAIHASYLIRFAQKTFLHSVISVVGSEVCFLDAEERCTLFL